MAESTNRIIVCGDSFNIGIGCRDLHTEPYASLLAAKLDRPLINLAKGSSTNLSIWLQVKYAVEELRANSSDIVLVNETSSNRFNWFPQGIDVQEREITNLDVNYHDYPPYGNNSYWPQQLDTHPMQDHHGYKGTMLTENINGIIDYLDVFVANGWNQRGSYYNRILDEPEAKLRLIKDFYASVYNEQLSQLQSQAFMSMASTLLSNTGANHVMLLPWIELYKDLIKDDNILRFSWGAITLECPDDVNTGHASAQGHVLAYEMIVNKLQENGWIQ
jgi:hypothetical protein